MESAARRLKDLAEIIGGEVIGDAEIEINRVSSVKDASHGSITFVSSPRYLSELYRSNPTAVIISREIEDPQKVVESFREKGHSISVLLVKNPHYAFAQILELFSTPPYIPTGISDKAMISKSAIIGRDVSIHPFVIICNGAEIGNGVILYPGVYVGNNSRIGDDTIIYPNVSIREGVIIGSGVIIHSGSVIGSDGFGYVTENGRHYKIPQIGGVVIEDDVEIGACVTVDRGTLGNTVIKRGTKIDNLVQVAHNVIIGEDSIIIAQVGISGSTELGDHVTLAGQVGVVDHVKIGSRAVVGAQSGVAKDVEPGEIVSGSPAISHKDWLKASTIFTRLPELRKKLKELEERIKKLEESSDKGGD
ncbi:MAG: UDP-3-O-(3-hydroxymyristoyl)glucosamine N-acyltransferase [Nitrospirota bacterium]